MNATLAVLGLSGGELVLVLGINEFKKASREVTDEIERSVDEPLPPPAPKPPVSTANAENASQHSAVPKA